MPRWFLISLVHPAATFVLAMITTILPSTGLSGLGGTIIGVVGYAAALGTFMISLPGVLIIQRSGYVSSPHQPGWMTYAGIATVTMLTWLLCVLPVCWLVARLLRTENHPPTK